MVSVSVNGSHGSTTGLTENINQAYFDPNGDNSWAKYNSNGWYGIEDLRSDSEVTVTWKNAVFDKNTNKNLDLTITFSDFHQATNGDTENNMIVYNNPLDLIATNSLDYIAVSPRLTYSDGSGDYQGNYYWTIGSLDYDNSIESTGIVSGVKGVFINSQSTISPQAKKISNGRIVNANGQDTGFVTEYPKGTVYGFNANNPETFSDNLNKTVEGIPEALFYQGVTYLLGNGSSFSLIESWDNYKSDQFADLYVHWMGNVTNAIAPTITRYHKYEAKQSSVNYHYDTPSVSLLLYS